MIFGTTFFGVLYGCIVGLVWAVALHLSYKNGLIYGGSMGGALALVFAINQKYTEIKLKRELRGMTRTFGNFFFMLLLVGVITGLIAWAVRVIFY